MNYKYSTSEMQKTVINYSNYMLWTQNHKQLKKQVITKKQWILTI